MEHCIEDLAQVQQIFDLREVFFPVVQKTLPKAFHSHRPMKIPHVQAKEILVFRTNALGTRQMLMNLERLMQIHSEKGQM